MGDGSALIAPDLTLLRPGDDSAPLFLFPGHAGYLIHLIDLVHALDYPGPIYGIAYSGLDGAPPFYDRFEQEAERAAGIIRRACPAGPFRLVGYSIGGITALETARLLRREFGDAVVLGLIDTPQNDHSWPYGVWLPFIACKFARLRRRIRRSVSADLGASRAIRASPAAGGLGGVAAIPRGLQVPAIREPNYPFYSPYWTDDHTPNYSRVRYCSSMMGFHESEPL